MGVVSQQKEPKGTYQIFHIYIFYNLKIMKKMFEIFLVIFFAYNTMAMPQSSPDLTISDGSTNTDSNIDEGENSANTESVKDDDSTNTESVTDEDPVNIEPDEDEEEYSEDDTTTTTSTTSTSTPMTFDDESCSALGKRYKYILGRCYHFHKARKPNFEAQDRCRVVFGPDVRGHLFEPTSMEIFQLVNTTAAHIFGLGKDVHTGFEKVENELGETEIILSSTGEVAKWKPWIDNGDVDDIEEDYIRFFIRAERVWQDNNIGWSRSYICQSE